MDSSPRSHLLLSFLFFLNPFLSSPVSSNTISFDFQTFSIRNLTLIGDSYLRNGSIGLTQETGVPASSSGAAICNLPIQFRDSATNSTASFSTTFSFTITNPNPASYGDGLAFFISPDNSTLGSSGGYLGLFSSSGDVTDGSVIAVEFDARLDEGLNDTSDNHVGLDVDSPRSVVVAELASYGIQLKSGDLVTAWIDYYGNESRVVVWVGYSTTKPEKPVLSARFDLSPYLKEYMYAGFSASTEGSTEVHTIESWSFQTFGLPSLNLASYTPYNKSESEWSAVPEKQPEKPVPTADVSSHRKVSLSLAIMGPVAFCVALVVLLLISIKEWNKTKMDDKGFNQKVLRGPRRFSYRELSAATRGFQSSRIVGNGAFGTVFRATDPMSGAVYAVKRSKQAHEGKDEFIAELSIIGCLRHRNLVQLEGWCSEKGELLLVYEFMPNGSLDRVLYNRRESGTLTWAQRYNVATGIASALTYLHQECEKQVIHRDIKASNIMLDANFSPRLGDFGLARLMDHNKSPVSTLTAGTMGYLAPEYLQYGMATEKTDVFSYGVVVLEICCGRRPIDKRDGKDQKMVNLVDWVWGLYSEDKLIEAADQILNGDFNKEEILRLLLVGLSCANPNCVERPSMRQVLQILNCEAEPVTVPKMKPLLMFTTSAQLSLQEIVSDCDESVISSPSQNRLRCTE